MILKFLAAHTGKSWPMEQHGANCTYTVGIATHTSTLYETHLIFTVNILFHFIHITGLVSLFVLYVCITGKMVITAKKIVLVMYRGMWTLKAEEIQ